MNRRLVCSYLSGDTRANHVYGNISSLYLPFVKIIAKQGLSTSLCCAGVSGSLRLLQLFASSLLALLHVSHQLAGLTVDFGSKGGHVGHCLGQEFLLGQQLLRLGGCAAFSHITAEVQIRGRFFLFGLTGKGNCTRVDGPWHRMVGF